jgi:hypothetical protein
MRFDKMRRVEIKLYYIELFSLKFFFWRKKKKENLPRGHVATCTFSSGHVATFPNPRG